MIFLCSYTDITKLISSEIVKSCYRLTLTKRINVKNDDKSALAFMKHF